MNPLLRVQCKANAYRLLVICYHQGIGYGGGAGESVNAATMDRARDRERDMDVKLTDLLRDLRSILPRVMDPAATAPATPYSGPWAPLCAVHLLTRSNVETILSRLLRNDSLLDIMSHRAALYHAVFALLQVIAVGPVLILVSLLNKSQSSFMYLSLFGSRSFVSCASLSACLCLHLSIYL